MTDTELLNAIYRDLQDIKTVLGAQSASDDARQWSVLLLHEYAGGVDTDGNGLIFGHHFIFNQITEFLPPSLRGLQNEYTDGWKGKRLSLIEYIQSLTNEVLKTQVINWLEIARERN